MMMRHARKEHVWYLAFGFRHLICLWVHKMMIEETTTARIAFASLRSKSARDSSSDAQEAKREKKKERESASISTMAKTPHSLPSL